MQQVLVDDPLVRPMEQQFAEKAPETPPTSLAERLSFSRKEKAQA